MTTIEMTALRTIAAFLMAGLYVTTMARAAERLGSKIGGLLLGLPSVILVGSIFIALSGGQRGLHQASTVMPATIAAASIFLTVFVRLARRGLVVAYSGAIAVWLAITIPLALNHVDNIWLVLMLSAVLLGASTFAFRNSVHRSAQRMTHSRWLFVVRFAVAGTIAGATVIVAQLAGSLWGAVCASFPAVFASSLFLMVRAQGIEFTRSLGRTMIFGCMANVVFAIALYVLGLRLGLPGTIVLAYVCSLLFGLFAYRYLIEAFSRVRGDASTGP